MLFVPWIYKRLEAREIKPPRFALYADKAERDLIDALKRHLGPEERGVFGAQSGRGLKRLPSSVYWAGLHSWGIQQTSLSQDQYHRRIDQIYHRRHAQEEWLRDMTKIGDDTDSPPDLATVTWHPQLPPTPDVFPDGLNFNLTSEEAFFIRDQIQASHPTSLLAHLALNCEPAKIDAPWLHPNLADFKQAHIDVLNHARLFSLSMHGAALLYNLALARRAERSELEEALLVRFQDWISELDLDELARWSLGELMQTVVGVGPTITPQTMKFVKSWIELVLRKKGRISRNAEAESLIQQREQKLKRSRSRFTNRRALELWSGRAGLARLTYRWPTASTFLRDLYEGLKSDA